MRGFLALSVASLATAVLAVPTSSTNGTLRCRGGQPKAPTVNLGYEIHTATINTTGNYYNFSNIPYADQPVGNLRFKQTRLPTGTSSKVNDGSIAAVCLQAFPQWFIDETAQASGVSSAVVENVLFNTPDQTESCLMLDVFVPADVFNAGASAKVPVLLWIHGGGFTIGSKTSVGAPPEILARSKAANSTGVIFVSINYRLGMFGWLAGEGSGVTPNLGLYDQRLAFDWVKKYISLFGGDPNKLTVMGESAGASSILHHMTAFGGSETPKFARAATFSPAFQFNINFTENFQKTLTAASSVAGFTVNSVASLCEMSTDQLRKINWNTVLPADIGLFHFGPGVDGTLVSKYPQVLLAEGKFDQSVQLLASHTSNESVTFVSPEIQTAAYLRNYISDPFLPEASNETVTTLLTDVYPDVLDGTFPWTTEFTRAVTIATEVNFACSTRFMSLALGNNSFNAIFSYPPGFHATDVPYIFFNGDTTTLNNGLPVNPSLAFDMQDYIVNFAMSGNPNTGVPVGVEWPVYGAEANIVDFGVSGVTTGVDNMANSRCAWIQQAMVDGLI